MIFSHILTLDQLPLGEAGKILWMKPPSPLLEKGLLWEEAQTVLIQLLELGFLEGAWVEVLHESPWGRDPMVVRVRGGKVALRRELAHWIGIEKGVSPQ